MSVNSSLHTGNPNQIELAQIQIEVKFVAKTIPNNVKIINFRVDKNQKNLI